MLRLRQRPRVLIGLLLLVLLARALIPGGFMPAGDGSAQLTLCPAGMLMPADDGAAPGGAAPHSHIDHCPFGSAPFAAPIATLSATPVLAASVRHLRFETLSQAPRDRAARAHQPRGPPA